MSRRPKAVADQAELATQPRPTDDAGYQLDEWGLPLVGPARLRALAGRPDPRDDLEASAAPSASGSEQQSES